MYRPPAYSFRSSTKEWPTADHTEVIITRQDVLDSLETVVELLGTYDITTIRASVGMYLV